jgi:hypothetical protein
MQQRALHAATAFSSVLLGSKWDATIGEKQQKLWPFI